MSTRHYRELDHTADIGIEVRARSLEKLFANTAFALFDIVADVERVVPEVSAEVAIQADDLEGLMVGWLNELIYRISAEEMLYNTAEVSRAGPDGLSATVYGERYDPARHRLRTEVKAATYHELCVERAKGRWRARVIFDV